MAIPIKQIKTSDNVIHDIQGIEYIVGTQSSATNMWKGVSESAELYAGKIINYKLPYAGSTNTNTHTGLTTNTTLELTLANGSTVVHPVYRNASTAITTHYPVNSIIRFVFDPTSVTINGHAFSGSWKTADYDYNTNTYVAQSVTTTNSNLPLILKASTSTSTVTTTVRFNSKLTGNPSAGSIKLNTTSITPTASSAVTLNLPATGGTLALTSDIPESLPPTAHTHSWGDITNPPSAYTPTAHTHPASDIDLTGYLTDSDLVDAVTPVLASGTVAARIAGKTIYAPTNTDQNVYQAKDYSSSSRRLLLASQDGVETISGVTSSVYVADNIATKSTGDGGLIVFPYGDTNEYKTRQTVIDPDRIEFILRDTLESDSNVYYGVLNPPAKPFGSQHQFDNREYDADWYLPSRSGTLALLSDIPSISISATTTSVATSVGSNGTATVLTGIKFTSSTTALTSVTASTTSIYPAANVTALTSVTRSTASIYPAANITALTSVTSSTTSIYPAANITAVTSITKSTTTMYGTGAQENVCSSPTVSADGTLSWTLVTVANGTSATVVTDVTSSGKAVRDTAATVVNAITVPVGKSVRDSATTVVNAVTINSGTSVRGTAVTVATGSLTTGTATVGTAVGSNGTTTALTGVKVTGTTVVVSGITST